MFKNCQKNENGREETKDTLNTILKLFKCMFLQNGKAASGHPSKEGRRPSSTAPLWIPFEEKVFE